MVMQRTDRDVCDALGGVMLGTAIGTTMWLVLLALVYVCLSPDTEGVAPTPWRAPEAGHGGVSVQTPYSEDLL